MALHRILCAALLLLVPQACAHSHAYYNGGAGTGLPASYLFKQGFKSEDDYIAKLALAGQSGEGGKTDPESLRKEMHICEVCYITTTEILRQLEKTAKVLREHLWGVETTAGSQSVLPSSPSPPPSPSSLINRSRRCSA